MFVCACVCCGHVHCLTIWEDVRSHHCCMMKAWQRKQKSQQTCNTAVKDKTPLNAIFTSLFIHFLSQLLIPMNTGFDLFMEWGKINSSPEKNNFIERKCRDTFVYTARGSRWNVNDNFTFAQSRLTRCLQTSCQGYWVKPESPWTKTKSKSRRFLSIPKTLYSLDLFNVAKLFFVVVGICLTIFSF